MSLNPHSKTWARDLESAKASEASTRSPSPLCAPPLLHHDVYHMHDLAPLETDSSSDHLENLLHPNYRHDSTHHYPHHSEKPHPTAITIDAFPHIHGRHPVTSQRQLYLLACTSALTVGLGLGGAVGVWKTIHRVIEDATRHSHPHLSNWPAGFLMGFVLAPIFETSTRAFFAKATGVLTVPKPPPARGGFFSARAVTHRFVTHLLTVSAALIGLGAAKGVQMQYGPTRGVLALEFPTFVVGFTLYGLVRLVMETITWNCKLWIDYFKEVVDPGEHWLWIPRGLEIGFFFTLFSTFKELTAVLAVLLFGGK
ncbi:hypothetical protein B0T18DRAFT_491123 [Schizothecium vesticola]|uniref:Uncharacterized protein n=1 Tax=Schizothecium vesticola TaxID=314040 RepID=A0AA40EJI3_9PEZI|nr:hypothetical protein B0T18DRAFT_491123 [Schizothecium vesticola]